MRLLRSRLLLAVAAAALAGCGEDSTTAPPTSGGPLIPARWYLHTANDSSLPAVISSRVVGVALERTFLDSAWLDIRADLTYSQRYWLRVEVTAVPDREEVVLDEGTIAPNGSGFRLTSTVRTREFTLSVPFLGQVATSEQMLFFATNPPITDGLYKLTHP